MIKQRCVYFCDISIQNTTFSSPVHKVPTMSHCEGLCLWLSVNIFLKPSLNTYWTLLKMISVWSPTKVVPGVKNALIGSQGVICWIISQNIQMASKPLGQIHRKIIHGWPLQKANICLADKLSHQVKKGALKIQTNFVHYKA